MASAVTTFNTYTRLVLEFKCKHSKSFRGAPELPTASPPMFPPGPGVHSPPEGPLTSHPQYHHQPVHSDSGGVGFSSELHTRNFNTGPAGSLRRGSRVICRGRTVLEVSGFGEQAEPYLTCCFVINMCLSQSLFLERDFQRLRTRVFKVQVQGAYARCPRSLFCHSLVSLQSPTPAPRVTHSEVPSCLSDCWLYARFWEIKRGVKYSSCPLEADQLGHLSWIWKNGGG